MAELYLWSLSFAISLFVLIKASDYFTVSAEKIGIVFGIPEFIVGVTIVALGTSLPELVSSIFAVLRDSSEIVAGNVVGSNITNIFLVLGIAAIVGKNLKVSRELIHVDLPFLIGSAFLIAVMMWDGVFTKREGILCFAGIFLYLHYTSRSIEEEKGFFRKWYEKIISKRKQKLEFGVFVILIISAVFIYFGAEYTIISIVKLSEILNIGKEIIAVSAVALGTSLPELTVSITAARKGNAEMAVGNVLGSNIFNSFVVMGIPALFGAIIIPQSILLLGLPIMLIASLLYFFMAQNKVISRWEGGLLMIFYLFFIGKVLEVI